MPRGQRRSSPGHMRMLVVGGGCGGGSGDDRWAGWVGGVAVLVCKNNTKYVNTPFFVTNEMCRKLWVVGWVGVTLQRRQQPTPDFTSQTAQTTLTNRFS